MDKYTFIVELTKALIWPFIIVILILYFNRPIRDVFKHLGKIKYKDLEIELENTRQEIPKDELADANKTKTDIDIQIFQLAKSSPIQSILKSWELTEEVIRNKLMELYPKVSISPERLDKTGTVNALLLTGALTRKEESVLTKLYWFKMNFERHFVEEPTTEIALEYQELCKYIQHKVNSLTDLPQVQLTSLTYMILVLNAAIDSGKYNNITVQDIGKEIEKGTALKYLSNLGFDISILIDSDTDPNFERFYISRLQEFYGAFGDDGRKWEVKNLGLSFLLAWTNEIVQQGSGWYPSN